MRFFALLLAVALMALASGCGSEKDKGKYKDLGKPRQGGDIKVTRAPNAAPELG